MRCAVATRPSETRRRCYGHARTISKRSSVHKSPTRTMRDTTPREDAITHRTLATCSRAENLQASHPRAAHRATTLTRDHQCSDEEAHRHDDNHDKRGIYANAPHTTGRATAKARTHAASNTQCRRIPHPSATQDSAAHREWMPKGKPSRPPAESHEPTSTQTGRADALRFRRNEAPTRTHDTQPQ